MFGYNGAFNASCYTIKATASGTGSCESAYDVSTNETISGAAVIPFNTRVTGLINPTGDIDHYKFKMNTSGTITLSLTDLPADYDIKLLNSAGSQLAISQNGSTTNESISFTVTAGVTYYAQVYGYSGATNASLCYSVQVTLGTATKFELAISFTGKNAFEAYPNPVQDVLNVNVSGLENVSSMDLYDVNGRKVITKTGVKGNTRINVSALTPGLYLLKIMNGEKVISMKKIVKG